MQVRNADESTQAAVESGAVENRQFHHNCKQQRLFQDRDQVGRNSKVETEEEGGRERQPDRSHLANPLQPDIDVTVVHSDLSGNGGAADTGSGSLEAIAPGTTNLGRRARSRTLHTHWATYCTCSCV